MNNINAGGVVAFDFMVEGSLKANMAYIGATEAGTGNEYFAVNYNPGNIPINIGGTKCYVGWNSGSPATNDSISMLQVNGGVACNSKQHGDGYNLPAISINGGSGFFGGVGTFGFVLDIGTNGYSNGGIALNGDMCIGNGGFTDPAPGQAYDLKMGGSGAGAIAALGNINVAPVS